MQLPQNMPDDIESAHAGANTDGERTYHKVSSRESIDVLAPIAFIMLCHSLLEPGMCNGVRLQQSTLICRRSAMQ